MNNKRQYFKILADAAIPLLGYFLWDWGIYFIFLFYALDLITREVLMHFKSRKIDVNQANAKNVTNNYLVFLSTFALFLLLILMHVISFLMIPKINFVKEVISFLSYSEMGIQQGYILIPLIAFAGYAEYKTEFILSKKFLIVTKAELWRTHIRSSVLLIILGIVLTSISFFNKDIEWLVLLIIILSIIIFQLIPKRIKN